MKKCGFLFSSLIPVALCATLCLTSIEGCIEKPYIDEEEADSTYQAKKCLRDEYMSYYYYWCKDISGKLSSVEISSYPDIYDYFDALLYDADRWSWMCDRDYYISEQTGVETGSWGVSLGQPIDYYGSYALRVRYIHPGSPFERFGVTRGAQMTHIGGKSIEEPFDQSKLNIFNEEYAKSSNTFTFRLADGRDTTFTASRAAALSTRSYLCSKIFTQKDFAGLSEPVGYFNYLSFNCNFIDDITGNMALMREAGVRKLILDLRYNGGGDSEASDTLVSFLAPASAEGKTYVSRRHNEYLQSRDSDDAVKDNAGRLDLDALYVITGSGTASASEMVINGLKPFMQIKTVGDTTFGKPNGMYVLLYPNDRDDYKKYNDGDFTSLEWVFLPICFYNKNGKGESIPNTGFVPDDGRPDDLFHDFSPEEDNIKACLTHIVTGSFPNLPARTRATVFGKGTRAFTEEEKADPHYGLYLVKP